VSSENIYCLLGGTSSCGVNLLYVVIISSDLTNKPRTIVNEAAAASPKQPIVNLGQGFFGYNPPQFIIDAAKNALDRVECNQYSPTRGRPRLQKAIADSYSPLWGRKLDPSEVTITTGANEGEKTGIGYWSGADKTGMLSAFMAFIEPGDEVIVFEPFFDQ